MSICASPGSFTDVLEEAILGHVLNLAEYTPPEKVYAGLGDFNETGGTEITGKGYRRQRILFNDPSTDNDGVTFIKSKCDIYFGPALADWPSFINLGIFPVKVGGDPIAYCTFPLDEFSVKEDEQLYLLAGNVDIRMRAPTSFQPGRWSSYLQEKILAHVFQNILYPQPSLEAAITVTMPPFDGSGSNLTEPSGGGYSRVVPEFSTPAQYLEDYAASYNTKYAKFGTATTDWFYPEEQGVLVYCDENNNLLFLCGTSIAQWIRSGDTTYLANEEDYNQVGIH